MTPFRSGVSGSRDAEEYLGPGADTQVVDIKPDTGLEGNLGSRLVVVGFCMWGDSSSRPEGGQGGWLQPGVSPSSAESEPGTM